jgi:hypothetical protein
VPRELRRSDLATVVPPGGTVFVAGGTAAPTAILGAWQDARALERVRMVGVPIPGLNHLVPAELGDDCRLRTSARAKRSPIWSISEPSEKLEIYPRSAGRLQDPGLSNATGTGAKAARSTEKIDC